MIRVNLELGKGDLLTGFDSVNAKLTDQQGELFCNLRGSLPAKPEIQDCYNNWHKLYIFLLDNSRIEMAEEEYFSNFSTADFFTYCESLKQYINDWFDSQEFKKIKEGLLSETNKNDLIEIILETEDNMIRRLPLHLWNFIEKVRPHCEIAFNKPDWTRKQSSKTPLGQVRILGILGDTSGINLGKDEEQLNQLQSRARVDLEIGREPTIEKFSHLLWARKGWNILYFAGHSFRQGNNGVIKLNQNEYLSIKELKNGLQQAIRKGLQIAIFNSCDGLGLAQDLQDLHIPVVIVMREPVPDYVAHEFIKYFLDAFSQNDDVSIYQAMREARERLFETVERQKNQTNEDKYPCASWLPIMFVNPAVQSPTWKDLRNDSPPINSWNVLKIAFLASFICTTLVMGMRSLGWLQTWEQKNYDQLITLRRDEGKDDRLLIIAIDDEYKIPFPDFYLYQLLVELKDKKISAIGLDLIRDEPVGSYSNKLNGRQNQERQELNEKQNQELRDLLEHNSTLILACSGDLRKRDGEKDDGNKPLPEVVAQTKRVGFIDLFPDNDDIIRRQTLIQEEYSPCPSEFSEVNFTYSFSLQLASLYLQKVKNIEITYTDEGYLQLDNKVFKPLEEGVGLYHKIDDKGHQILLNYRSSKEIADTITLKEFLEKPNNSEDFENPIIIIGRIEGQPPDVHSTPYTTYPETKEYGVLIHAHMVSQIISAVVDNRPLIWFLPSWGDIIFAGSYSLIIGILGVWAWKFHSPLFIVVIITGGTIIFSLSILYGVSLILFSSQGLYLPIIPTTLSSMTTALVIFGSYFKPIF